MTNSRKHQQDGHREHHAHHQPPHNNMNHRNKDFNSKQQSITTSDDDSRGAPVTRFFFGVLWCFAQVFLWGSVLLFLYYILKFDRGFAWTGDASKQFNLHAFLMITGFIFLNGQAMLIYKTFLCCKKIYNKITHTIFFVLSSSLITFGMIVAIYGHQKPNPNDTYHFYTIHSWAGLVTVGLFALQFLVGFVSFLVLLCCEKATAGYRAKILPTHVSFGLIIFSMAVVTCLSGLLQTARIRLSGKDGKPDYKELFSPANPFLNPAIVINLVGVCFIGLAIVMPYIVRNFSQRQRQGSFSLH